jgi:hypothetical protein
MGSKKGVKDGRRRRGIGSTALSSAFEMRLKLQQDHREGGVLLAPPRIV